MRGGRVNEVSKQCYQPPIPLTLFPCISTHLKVIDSTYFIQTYKPMSYLPPPQKKIKLNKFQKWPINQHLRKSLFLLKCAPFGQISIFWALFCFANILILIVLTDSTIKTLCYMRSCGVNFKNSEIFRFLRGPKNFSLFLNHSLWHWEVLILVIPL